MRIITKAKIERYFNTTGREDSRNALLFWIQTVRNAEWRCYADMKHDFNSVDAVGNQHYVFNINGNKHRLIVVIKFVAGLVYVRWIGTHAEYDKINCRTI